MNLSKGEIIVLSDGFFSEVDVKELSIKNIGKSIDGVVMDITTESGYFQDSFGIQQKNCSGHSVRAIAMHGLGGHFKFEVVSKPAKSAQVLVGHINTYLCTIAKYYAGALGLDFVNIAFAPYLEGATDEEMKQVAQYMIFSIAQSAFSRGGQTLFVDFNLFPKTPDWLGKVRAVGPSGKLLKRTYASYEETSQRFLRAIFEVVREGDALGQPFAFPKCFDKETPLFTSVDGVLKYSTVGDVLKHYESKSTILLPRFNQSTKKKEWVKVKGAQYRGEETGIRIKLNNGSIQDSTKDHKYYCWKDDKITVVEAQNLQLGDVLLFSSPNIDSTDTYQTVDVFDALKNDDYQVYNVKNSSDSISAIRDGWCRMSLCTKENLTETSYICTSKQKKNSMPVKLTVDEKWGKLFGYFASEGCFTGNSIRIAALRGNRCRLDIEALLYELGIDHGGNQGTVIIYNAMLVNFIHSLFEFYGETKFNYSRPACSKHVPDVIFKSPKSVQIAFLQGMFAGNGTIKNYGFGLSSSSESLIYGCKWLLEGLGIYSSIYGETINGYEGVYYHLCIKGKRSVTEAWKILKDCLLASEGIGDRSNKDASWYNSIPVQCFGLDNKVCQWEKDSRNYMPLDDDRVTKVSALEGLIPVTVKGIEDVEIEAIAIEVDCSEHDFITGEGVLTKNCNFHVVKECFEEGEPKELLKLACQISSENGSPYFVFDHDSITIAACCRLRARIEDAKVLETPELFRFAGVQNVSINLPQCALRADGDRKKFESELAKAMGLAKKAHLQKKKFVESICQNPTDPLYEVCKKEYFDGKPYVDLDKSTYIIGIVGLNECVQCLTGKELHDDEETFKYGKYIIAYMLSVLGKFKKETGLKFSLEESPAESAVRRMAKSNIERYPERKDLVRGSLEDDNIYLTNSIHFRPDADIPFVDRVFKQSEFHNMIESGAIIHMFCGENMPEPESLFKLLEKVYKNTNCAQLVVSPEFTICSKCGRFNGLHEVCPKCGDENVDRMTRVVGYYSKVDNWNISKKREGKDRGLGKYTI